MRPSRNLIRWAAPGAVAAAALVAAIATVAAYADGPPTAHTGGFGEPTCHACHFDSAINSGPAVLRMSAPETYEPGERYALGVTLERAGLARAGFQLTVRFAGGPAAGRQAGSLRPVDDRVTVVAGTDTPSVAYAHHTATGTHPGQTGSAAWRIDWIAPQRAQGPVIVHVAANAANDDASEFGDHIHTDSTLVPQQASHATPRSTRSPQVAGTTAELRGISAPTESVIWASGRGGAYTRSLDGGDSWSAGTIPGAENLFLIDVHAVSADTAYVLGTHFDGGLGVIYKTADGGHSWTEQYRTAGAGVFFDGMAFWDAEHGIAVSDPVDGAFLIVTTTDGGATWRRVPPESIPAPLPGEAGFAASGTAITTQGDRDVWFGTGGASVARVFRSGDRGRTWTVVETPLPAGTTAGVFGIAFRDLRNGVAVGGDHRRPDEATTNVARTTDGGHTWTLTGSSAPAGVRYGVAYVPNAAAEALVAVGPSGWGYSLDDGASWVPIDTVGHNTVAATTSGHVWAGGVDGRVSHWLVADPDRAQNDSPLDTLLDVGGHRLHFVVHRGTESVTLVLEAGGGAALDSWSGLASKLADRTRATVVAYERAGFGRSELGPAELTPEQQVRHLAGALEKLGTPQRRIVVGHSYGGLMAMLHADVFADDVVGLVLVDPMNPRFVEATGDFVKSTAPQIEQPRSDAERAVVRLTRTLDGLLERVRRAEESLRVPMVVVTAGEPWWGREDIDAAWRASHQALVSGQPGRRLVVADGSDHDVPEKRPDVLLEAVISLLDRVSAQPGRSR